MDLFLHTFFVVYCRCILPLYCIVVLHFNCFELSLLLTFAQLLTFVVSYFRCFILALFCTFCYFVLLLFCTFVFFNLLFHTSLVVHFFT